MARYLREPDPYDRPITTSVSYREIPGLWSISEVHIVQIHHYGPTDRIPSIIERRVERHGSPCVVGELAYDWRSPEEVGRDHRYERELHLGLRRGLFAPTPVLPLTWWWEHHHARSELYHVGAVAHFAGDMKRYAGSGFTPFDHEFHYPVVRGGGLELLGLATEGVFFLGLATLRQFLSIGTGERAATVAGPEEGECVISCYSTCEGRYYRGEPVTALGVTVL